MYILSLLFIVSIFVLHTSSEGTNMCTENSYDRLSCASIECKGDTYNHDRVISRCCAPNKMVYCTCRGEGLCVCKD